MWNLTAEERVWRGRAGRQNLGEQTMIWRLRSSTRSWCSLIKSTGTMTLNTSSAFLGQTEWLRSAFCKKSKANHKCFILVWHQMQQFKICLYSQVRLWDSFAHHERATASSAVLYYLIWFRNYMAIQALRVQTKVDIKYPYLNARYTRWRCATLRFWHLLVTQKKRASIYALVKIIQICHKVCVQTPTRPAALHSSCLASSLSSYFFPAV